MVKRISKGATTINIGSAAGLAKAVSTIREMNAQDEV
jgi:hypothetical protein